MAFGSNRDRHWQVLVAPTGAMDRRSLADLGRDHRGTLAWSPNDRRPAFEVDGHAVGQRWVSVVCPDDVDLTPRRLTPADGVDLDRAWSPDGHTTAVAAMRTQEFRSYADMIWVERTSELELIDARTFERTPITASGLDLTNPTWSHDGAHLAFVADHTLYVVPRAGGEPSLLRSNVVSGAHPRWSPDDSAIAIQAFTMKDTPAGAPHARRSIPLNQLVVINRATIESTPIELTFEVWHYAWSADGTTVLCTGGSQLVAIDPETTTITPRLKNVGFWSSVTVVPAVTYAPGT